MTSVESWIGHLAATCTTLSFVPQVWKILESGDTRAISLPMYVLFFIGINLWLIYGLLRQDWPIVYANVITIGLTGVVLQRKLSAVRSGREKR